MTTIAYGNAVAYPTEYPRISMMYMTIRRMMAQGKHEDEIIETVMEKLQEDEHGNLREG